MNQWRLAAGAQVAGVTVKNVQQIGDEIYRLVVKTKTLAPEVLVDGAKSPRSPLNPIIFRLNEKEAAAEYRLVIARNLIHSVRAITEQGEETLEQRVYVNVITEAGRGYMLIPTVMGDAALREQVLEKAKADLQAWRERYEELEELAEVFAVVDKVVASPPPVRKRRSVEKEL